MNPGITLNDDYNGTVSVACPVCESDDVHLVSVRVTGKSTAHSVIGGLDTYKDENVTAYEDNVDHSRRGSAVATSFAGECGHRWTVAMTFHKGSVYVETIDIEEDPERAIPKRTLWRD